MCVEFTETASRLVEWAKWKRGGNSVKELSYPTSSSHTKQFGGGGYVGIPDSPDDEQVDKLVAQLEIKYNDLHEVLMSKYFYGDNDKDGALSCCIKPTKYRSILDIAVSWIDRGLYDFN